jgi:hypothetical protein
MRKFLIAAAAASAMALTVSTGALAASAPGQQLLAPNLATQSLVEHVQYGYGYRRRCRHWHRTCRYRWGYGWRYRRCMRIHGC